MTDFATADYFSDQAIAQDRYEYLDYIRAQNPVLRLEPLGFVAVTGYDEAVAAFKDYETFSAVNAIGGPFPPLPFVPEGDDISAQIDAHRHLFPINEMMVVMDPPEHTRARSLLSRLLTPARLKEHEDFMWELADRQLDEFIGNGKCELLAEYGKPFATLVIADLMGVPQDERKKLFDWSNQMVGEADPEFHRNDPQGAAGELIMYGMQMAADRTANPGDDLVTKLVQADVDGHKLSDDEFGFFVILLAVAGNETTRNSITHGMTAFTDFPDQWELYKAQRPITAVDEIVRWATPVTSFQRTALEDVELSGVQIKKGQRVVMSYRSANFDEEVFDDPFTFNILRDPNPHVGFGGTGAHYCLGANLARMTIDLMFNAIADHIPDLKSLSKPERLRSGWLNGIKHWQVDYTGSGAGK